MSKPLRSLFCDYLICIPINQKYFRPMASVGTHVHTVYISISDSKHTNSEVKRECRGLHHSVDTCTNSYCNQTGYIFLVPNSINSGIISTDRHSYTSGERSLLAEGTCPSESELGYTTDSSVKFLRYLQILPKNMSIVA